MAVPVAAPQSAARSLRIREYLWAAAIVGLTTLVALVLRPYLQITDIAMLFLLAVVFVAYRHRRGAAVVASILSIAAFDFGFVPPYQTFRVDDPAYLLTFAVMLGVALTMSQLTGRIREQAENAREGESQAAALYHLERGLAEVDDLETQIAVATSHIARAGQGEALILLDDAEGGGGPDRWPVDGVFDSVAVRVAATLAYQQGESTGWGTESCAESEALVIPLRGTARTAGIVVLRPSPADRIPAEGERRFLEALSAQAALAFERTGLAGGEQRARAEVESERLRTALLSSLSHDLRTPLGSIEGAASSLLQESGALPAEARREMAETILQESRRMTRLVANLLDMVRVETGALSVQKEWQPLEEALGVALLRLEERLAGHPVETRLPAALPLVPIDGLLIEQVFINLLENAVKHTPPGTPIAVAAWTEGQAVEVEVADQGGGIPAGDEEMIFGKFHRGSTQEQAGPAGGAGLGLTICRGIVAAHGGRIWLERKPGVGAAFRFTLPLGGTPPRPLPHEALEA